MQKTLLATISAVAALTFSASAQNQSANSYTASSHVQVGSTQPGNSNNAKKFNTTRIFTLHGIEATSPWGDGALNSRFGLITRTYLTKTNNTNTFDPLVAFIGGTQDTTFQWGLSEINKTTYFPLLTLHPASLSLHSTTPNQLKAYFPRNLADPILFQGDLDLSGSLGALGSDNILPNQILTGPHSILTAAIADSRYALKSEIPNLSAPWQALTLSSTTSTLDALSPAPGQIIFHNNTFLGYDGSRWQTLGSTSTTFDISPSKISFEEILLIGNRFTSVANDRYDVQSELITIGSSEAMIRTQPQHIELNAETKIKISSNINEIDSESTKFTSSELILNAQTTTITGAIRIQPQGDLSMGPFTAE